MFASARFVSSVDLAMKLTRERKIFGAVLVLALGFLGYDQLSGGGANADAATAEADAANLLLASAPGSSSHRSGAAAIDTSNDISLASRLSAMAGKTGAVAQPDRMRDVFRPVEGWITKPAPKIAAAPTVSSADQFVAEHKLTAISTTNVTGGGVAVVDGTLLHVGGAIDGYRLVAIDRQQAIFESSDGGRAKLMLASPSTSSGAGTMSSASTTGTAGR